MNKKHLIFALIFPILALITLISYKQARLMIGKEIILPISGFDPRDILSGHYLIYRIDYHIINDNAMDYAESNTDAYICLRKENKNSDEYSSTIYHGSAADISASNSSECFCIIQGKYSYKRFTAGVEKFFIPEEYAQSLDRAVRNRQGKIILSVSGDGKAVIKDLLIDGKSWKEYTKDNTKD